VPEEDPVMLPVQAKSPASLVIVQPVEEEPPARLTLPVEVPAMLTCPVVPASKARLVPAPVETAPAPTKPRAVAETEMVSMEATPVRAPAVLALRPPLEISCKVPVALPMVVLPVPVVAILTAETPAVPRLVMPEEVRVVKAPVLAMVAPTAVLLMPVVVVLKLLAVIKRLLAPAEREDSDKPDKARAPEVAVRFKAPVVKVKPLEAVRMEEKRPVPITSKVVPGIVVPMPTLPVLNIVR